MFFWISCVPRVLVKTLEGVGEQASADESKLDLEVQYNLSGLAMAVLQLIGILVGMSQVSLVVLLIILPVAATCLWMEVMMFSQFSCMRICKGFSLISSLLMLT
jgi:hypothetical protein